jgi:hypothetical protein
MTLEEIIERVSTALEIMAPIRGHIEADISPETALALGELMGVIVRLKVSIKRDVEIKRERG